MGRNGSKWALMDFSVTQIYLKTILAIVRADKLRFMVISWWFCGIFTIAYYFHVQLNPFEPIWTHFDRNCIYPFEPIFELFWTKFELIFNINLIEPHILREINFGWIERLKNCHFNYFREINTFKMSQILINSTFQSCENGQNSSF